MICYECDSEVGHKSGCSLDLADWSFMRRWRHGVWFSRRAEYGRRGVAALVDGFRWARLWGRK